MYNNTFKQEIPAGYMLAVESWENDADNYMTNVIAGLTKEDVAFYQDLITKLKAFGGEELTDENTLQILAELCTSHTDISKQLFDKVYYKELLEDLKLMAETGKVPEGFCYDSGVFLEILGSNNSYDGCVLLRTVASVKVFFVPTVLKEVVL